ncbi:hypothetical protein H4R35_005997 [Dimargaris xerosporica]|nr:hypothetical protein H4R35_005997 [Dimargaris xerosporica]
MKLQVGSLLAAAMLGVMTSASPQFNPNCQETRITICCASAQFAYDECPRTNRYCKCNAKRTYTHCFDGCPHHPELFTALRQEYLTCLGLPLTEGGSEVAAEAGVLGRN